MNWFKYLYILLISLSISCEKFVAVEPPVTSPVATSVFADDQSAISILTGIYTKMSQSAPMEFVGSVPSLSLFLGLYSDEYILSPNANSTALQAYYQNHLESAVAGSEYWPTFYSYIYSCNDAIENIERSIVLTSSVKTQLIGEAKFMRAFSYFYLVNLYGDLPLVLSTDYKANLLLARTDKQQIYTQIVQDLIDAKSQLSSQFLNGNLVSNTSERVRPTKWVASALLARVYLSMHDYTNAEIESSEVISQTQLFNLQPCDSVFLKNSFEAIWQLQPVSALTPNTPDAKLFIIPSTGMSSSNPVALSEFLLDAFESGDKRRSIWVDSIIIQGNTYYYPYKYKVASTQIVGQEYPTLFRLAEQYLIRSEARAQLDKLPESLEDLNSIRTRAGLSEKDDLNKSAILMDILHERQIEFFSELGHRWLDLKRLNAVNSVMTNVAGIKGGTWSEYKALFPLLNDEILRAPNLTQNIGYN